MQNKEKNNLIKSAKKAFDQAEWLKMDLNALIHQIKEWGEVDELIAADIITRIEYLDEWKDEVTTFTLEQLDRNEAEAEAEKQFSQIKDNTRRLQKNHGMR